MPQVRGTGWLWVAAAALCLAVAASYLLFGAETGTSAIGWFGERVLHASGWALLGLAALAKTRLTPLPERLAIPLAMFAGACYIAYILSGFVR